MGVKVENDKVDSTSNRSLEVVYEALRISQILVIEILHVEKKPDVNRTTGQKVLENPGSSSPLKDLLYDLQVNILLKCGINEEVFQDIASRFKASSNNANTLLDLYYSIGSLILIKDHASNVDARLADADGTFRCIKVRSILFVII
ncbi:hypothetical protein K1719_042518 [Acacia pycnantha]|nr:hypothetical protein K1719_042518 [Acacia pycnantha]